MDATAIIAELAKKARIAARSLANSSESARNQLLLNIADELEKNLDSILKANQIDMANAKSSGMNRSEERRVGKECRSR